MDLTWIEVIGHLREWREIGHWPSRELWSGAVTGMLCQIQNGPVAGSAGEPGPFLLNLA